MIVDFWPLSSSDYIGVYSQWRSDRLLIIYINCKNLINLGTADVIPLFFILIRKTACNSNNPGTLDVSYSYLYSDYLKTHQVQVHYRYFV